MDLEKAHKYIRRWKMNNGEWGYEYPQKHNNKNYSFKDVITKLVNKTTEIKDIKPLTTEEEIDTEIKRLTKLSEKGKLRCPALGNNNIYIEEMTTEHAKKTYGVYRTNEARIHKLQYLSFVEPVLKNGVLFMKSRKYNHSWSLDKVPERERTTYGIINKVTYFDNKKNKQITCGMEIVVAWDNKRKMFVFSFIDRQIKKSLLLNKDLNKASFEVSQVGASKKEAFTTTNYIIPQQENMSRKKSQRGNNMDFYFTKSVKAISLSMVKSMDFKQLKARLINHLKKQMKKEETKEFSKSLAVFEIMQKAAFPVGTIREWKGKKYIKTAPGKWMRKYDKSGGRGFNRALKNVMRKMEAAETPEELYAIIMQHSSRFRDENGNMLPEVQQLHELSQKKQSGMKEPEKQKNYLENTEKVKFTKNIKGEVYEEWNTDPNKFAVIYDKNTGKSKGLRMTQDIVDIINSVVEPSVLDWQDNVAEKVHEKYPEIKESYIKENIKQIRMGYRNGKPEKIEIIKEPENKTEEKTTQKENIATKGKFATDKQIDYVTEISNKKKFNKEKMLTKPVATIQKYANSRVEDFKGSIDEFIEYMADRQDGISLDEVAKEWSKLVNHNVARQIFEDYKDKKLVINDDGYFVENKTEEKQESEKKEDVNVDKEFNIVLKKRLSLLKKQLSLVKKRNSCINKQEKLLQHMRNGTGGDEDDLDIEFQNYQKKEKDLDKEIHKIDKELAKLPTIDEIESRLKTEEKQDKEQEISQTQKEVSDTINSYYDEMLEYTDWGTTSKIKKLGEKKLKELASVYIDIDKYKENLLNAAMEKIKEDPEKKDNIISAVKNLIYSKAWDVNLTEKARKKLDTINVKENEVDLPVSEQDMSEAKSIIGSDVDRILSGRDTYGNAKQTLADKIRRRFRNNPGVCRAMLVYIKQEQEKTGKEVFTSRNSIWELLPKLNENAKEAKTNGETETKTGVSGNIYSGDDGTTIVENKDWGRYQIALPGKPDREVITKLKQNGFRWSPSTKTWVGYNTANGERKMHEVAEFLGLKKEVKKSITSQVKNIFFGGF